MEQACGDGLADVGGVESGRAAAGAVAKLRDPRGRWLAAADIVTLDRKGRPIRAGRDGFDAAKQAAFLKALAKSLDIQKAARSAGVHRNTVNNHRRRNSDFRQRFGEVLSDAYRDLELRLLAMALNGMQVKVTVTKAKDGSKTTVREGHDVRMGLALLQLHHATVGAHEAAHGGFAGPMWHADHDKMPGWLIADIEAAEAAAAEGRATGGGADGDDRR